jgi:FkbM family methyltransferase
MVCFDIGANVGFYTLLFWSVTGPEGIVVAFEPLPENFALLGRHVEINGCGNVRIFPYAVADHDGMSRFERGQYNTNGRLSAKGDLLAQCYRLDTCMAEFNLAMPHVIKIDVEGAEADVLEGAANTIRASKPVIFVATHGEQPHRDCCRILTAAGYDLECLEGGPIELASEIVAIPRR